MSHPVDHLIPGVSDCGSSGNGHVKKGTRKETKKEIKMETMKKEVEEEEPKNEATMELVKKELKKETKKEVKKEIKKETKKQSKKSSSKQPVKLISDYFTRAKRVPFKVLVQQEERKIKHHLVSNSDPKGFKIIESQEKGKGIVTINKVSKGSFVCEYSGDLIKISEAKAREQEYEKEKFGCYMYFFDWNNRRYCVDATKPTGRIGRLINHSRKVPNLKTKVFPIDDVPHLIFIALRDIEPGEELLYDYGERNKDVIAAHPWLVTS